MDWLAAYSHDEDQWIPMIRWGEHGTQNVAIRLGFSTHAECIAWIREARRAPVTHGK